MVHSSVSHHKLTSSQPVLQQPWNLKLPLLYCWAQHYMVCNISLPSLGYLSWFCPLQSSLCSTPSSSLAGQHKKLKSQLNISAAQQQLKCRCVINIIIILNAKPSNRSSTREKIESISAKSRALYTDVY